MRVADVRVGQRCRREMGDVAGLARSIEELGLLHPIVVSPTGELIAGARRLAAFRLLGRDEIPATVVSLEAIERGEADENSQRKDFTPSEAVAIGRLLEERERERAEERRRAELRQFSDRSGNFPERANRGEVRDIVGAAVGLSGRTYSRAKAIVEAAEADPERFGSAVWEMDRSGRVAGVYDRVRAELTVDAPERAGTRRAPFKGRAATAERHARVAEMANAGYRDEDIARAVGMTAEGVGQLRSRQGIVSRAVSTSRNYTRKDPNAMVDGFIAAVEPPEAALRLIDWSAVDPDRVAEWDERLAAVVKTIAAVRGLLRRVRA